MKDILKTMSAEDKLSLIITDCHCWILGEDTTPKFFGYLPNTFELRYSRDQLAEAAESMSRCSFADGRLYESWQRNWWELRGKARLNQKLRVMGKMSEMEAALRETEAREIAAGRTTDARLQCKRDARENVYRNWREGLPIYTSRSTSPVTEAEDKNGDKDSITETRVQKKKWMTRFKERLDSGGSKINSTKTARGTAEKSSDDIDGATFCDEDGNSRKQMA